MLNTLQIRQFTVFQNVKFEFSPGLNVIVGDNGTGKTHVLKLGYLFSRAWSDLTARRTRVTAQAAEVYLEERLLGLFKVAELDSLAQHSGRGPIRLAAEVGAHIPTLKTSSSTIEKESVHGLAESMSWDVQIERRKDGRETVKARILPEVIPDKAALNAFLPRQVFIPSKEMVSLFKGLVGLFEKFSEFPLDETYRDLAISMSTLEPRDRPALHADAMSGIQELLGGDLTFEEGEIFFKRVDGSRLESQLMAEGHRKLALLSYLLRYGVIETNSTVFWDEPEANLNPAAQKLLAKALFVLAGLGVQVILATHSLFLLREFEILGLQTQEGSATPATRYFALSRKGNKAVVTQGNDVTAIEPLVALDENLQQSDRYMDASK